MIHWRWNRREYFCPKKLLSTNTLVQHYCTHTKEKHTRCKICHARFRHPSQLIRHKGSCKLLFGPCLVRSKPERQCKLCGLKLFGGTALVRHIRNEHTRDNKWKCYFCNNFFARIHPGHMAIHTGERHYLCKVCSAEFKHDIFLQRHNLRFLWMKTKNTIFHKRKLVILQKNIPSVTFVESHFSITEICWNIWTLIQEKGHISGVDVKVFFSLSSAVKKNCANHYGKKLANSIT